MSTFTEQLRAALTTPSTSSGLSPREANLRRIIIAQQGWDYEWFQKEGDESDSEDVAGWLKEALEELAKQDGWTGELPAMLVQIDDDSANFHLLDAIVLWDIENAFHDSGQNLPLNKPLPLGPSVTLFNLDGPAPTQASVALFNGALVPVGEWAPVEAD